MSGREALFWWAMCLAGGVVLMLTAARILRPREVKRRRWLPVIAALLLPPLLGCASAPQRPFVTIPDHHIVGAGWSDGVRPSTDFDDDPEIAT